jgi:hypothetical protein
MTGCLYIYPPSVSAVHDELRGVIDLELEQCADWWPGYVAASRRCR